MEPVDYTDVPSVGLPVLAQVSATMRCADPRLASLSQVADLISTFLDISVIRFTPAQAAAHNSPLLLDRVLKRVMPDSTVDPAFLSHWLARALANAIQNNNLANVQRIHSAHPKPLHVRSLQLALQHGTLEMVKWIVENRSDRLCCEPGIQNICIKCLNTAIPSSISSHDTKAIVEWIIDVGAHVQQLTSLHQYIDVARWLDENQQLQVDTLYDAIISSGPADAIETLHFLVTRGHSISDDDDLIGALVRGACQTDLTPLIDYVTSSPLCDSIRDKFVWSPTREGGPKVLQWDSTFLMHTLVYGATKLRHHVAYCAGQFCHVDTLEWLWSARGDVLINARVHDRHPKSERDLLGVYQWMLDTGVDGWGDDDQVCAARNGYLATIQWLHEHKPDCLTARTLDAAATHGHLEAIKWLHTNRSEGWSDNALRCAAQYGQLKVVEWLCVHRTQGDLNEVMVVAAVNGHLDVLAWLHAHRPENACGACVLRSVLSGSRAAPEVEAIRWLTAHDSRRVGCVGRCTTDRDQYGFRGFMCALVWGDLPAARYLWENHRTPLGDHVELVVQGGHLPAIQWLHSTERDTVDWQLVLEAAQEWGETQIAAGIERMLASNDE